MKPRAAAPCTGLRRQRSRDNWLLRLRFKAFAGRLKWRPLFFKRIAMRIMKLIAGTFLEAECVQKISNATMSALGHSRPRWSRLTLSLVRFSPKATKALHFRDSARFVTFSFDYRRHRW
jgi:hypothetical protein